MICSEKSKPRFKEIVNEVNIILYTSNNIDSFPFSIQKVIEEQTGIVCRNYNKARSYGVCIDSFGSQDAICIKYQEKHIIFYNNSPLIVRGRKRFSLSHELGHKVMDHDLDNKEMYDVFEVEANFFAAQLLMPEQIINELRKRGKQITPSNLQLWFGVSKEAATKRIETLNKINFKQMNEDEKFLNEYIVSKYKCFIDKIAPKSQNYDYYDPYEEEEEQKIRDSWYGKKYKGGFYIWG